MAKTGISARFARNCARYVRDTPTQTTPVPASCQDGPSVQISSPCNYCFYPKSQKQAFLRASRAIAHATRATRQHKPRQYRRLAKTDLRSEFRHPTTTASTQNGKNRHFCTLRAQLRALRARHAKTNHASTGVLPRRTFGSNFVALRQFLLPNVLEHLSERRGPPVLCLSPNLPQKGNLLASLGG